MNATVTEIFESDTITYRAATELVSGLQYEYLEANTPADDALEAVVDDLRQDLPVETIRFRWFDLRTLVTHDDCRNAMNALLLRLV